MVAHPVAQEAGWQVDQHRLALDAGEAHLPQPVAVFDVTDILPEARADACPAGGDLSGIGRGGIARILIHPCPQSLNTSLR